MFGEFRFLALFFLGFLSLTSPDFIQTGFNGGIQYHLKSGLISG